MWNNSKEPHEAKKKARTSKRQRQARPTRQLKLTGEPKQAMWTMLAKCWLS